MSQRVTFAFVLGNSPDKSGKYTIYLRITINRTKKLISVHIKTSKTHFKNGRFNALDPNQSEKNKVLKAILEKAEKINAEYKVEEYKYTPREFEERFRDNDATNNQVTTVQFFDQIVEEFRVIGKISTSKSYRECKNRLVAFKGTDDIHFKQITVAFLEEFELFLRQNNCNDGGVSIRMRTLKALINKAIKREIISSKSPFKVYKTSKFKVSDTKLALSKEEYKKLKNLDLSGRPHLVDPWNYFMFSIWGMGMNFADILNLKGTDIRDGRVYYTRIKTGKNISFELVDPAKKIIEYYTSFKVETEYVFPILLHNNLTPTQIENRKHKVLGRVNYRLRELAKLANIEKKLHFYVGRHSFATLLKKEGVNIAKISEMLGHQNINITQTYLKSFDNEELDSENRIFNEL